MPKRKIESMHGKFGIVEGKQCKTCSNFVRNQHGGTKVKKCVVYGYSHSSATDWNTGYTACGMHNKEYHGIEIYKVLQRMPRKERYEPIEGQLEIGG